MQKLPKCERLYRKKQIESLFKKGNSFNIGGIKAIYLFQKADSMTAGIKILVAVPQRIYKKAVSRNLIKRRLKEAYRLHKYRFNEKLKSEADACLLGLIYNDKEILDFKTIESKIIVILQRLEKEYDKIA